MTFLGIEVWMLAVAVVGLLLLRVRGAGTLTWAVAWWVALFVLIKYGFEVPVPQSVVTMYMAIVTASLLVYVSSSRERWREVREPIVSTMLERRRRPVLIAAMVFFPLLVAWTVYARMTVPLEAPAFGRSVHPAPPDRITVLEQEVNLVTAENPFKRLEETDPAAYEEHVANGRRVYFQNCFYCHGDGLGGDGMFAHALNPIPSNFLDSGVLPILQSSFVFWRVSKGGPGLPEEGGPWDTAMPAWENFLSVEEIWDVVLFLYDFTGYDPRAVGEELHE